MKNFSSRAAHPARQNRVYAVKEEAVLLEYLFSILKDQSKTTIKALLAHKQIVVNGRATTKFDTVLKAGDEISVLFNRNSTAFSNPLLNIVFEDDSLVIIDKMHGLLTMATERDKEKTAYHILSDYVKRNNSRNRIFIVHRLDRDTSGLLMFAKSPKVQEILQKDWNETVRERKYVAVVEGCPAKESGRIKSYISENSALIVHRSNAADGKLAITNYKILKSNGKYSLVDLELETGRKNQIRVHMQELGTPVAGDKKYGARTNPANRLTLHAYKLRFNHPITGKEMNFETPIPKKFTIIVK